MNKELKIIGGGIAVDDRGALRFCNDFNFAGVKRFYEVENHRRGYIRAWHGHEREGKYVWASGGSFLVGAAPLDAPKGDLSVVQKFVLSDSKPNILWIPPGYYNGFMSLTEGGRLMYFSTSTLEESHGDDIRLPYDAWDIWSDDFR
jgi:dTDP-4-dehydrorhamnose 3,5-epimerase